MIIDEYVDYTMSVGQSRRHRECDRCIGQGNSNAVQVTRKEDGFLIYCFRCDKTYFIPDTNASPVQVQDMLKNNKVKKFDGNPEVVVLPDDFTNKLPPLALVDLYKYEVRDRDIKWFNIGWSPMHQRIIYPFYRYGRFDSETGWAVKLVGWSGKKLEGDDNKKKPKWSTVRQRDIKHLKFIAIPDGAMKAETVVLVEDPISAIRVADAGYFCIGLHTTYLPDDLMPQLRGRQAIIWLDDDALAKAVKYVGKLGANGIKASHVHSKMDPKCYSRDEILDKLQNSAY
jgi:hypothetical protein